MRYRECAAKAFEKEKYDYWDWRASIKIMANVIGEKAWGKSGQPEFRRRLFPAPWGRFPFRRVTEEIRFGDPKAKDLQRWYAHAVRLVRNDQKLNAGT